MTTQIDLFAPARTWEQPNTLSTCEETLAADTPIDDAPTDENLGQPIAVPCGFRDRANNSCRRLGNWPVMMIGKQIVCRGRPMLHCDPACFSSAVTVMGSSGGDDGDIVWENQTDAYDDNS